MIIVYSKPNCPQCDKVKHELKSTNSEYKEIVVGKDITREEFLEKFPHVRTMPHVEMED